MKELIQAFKELSDFYSLKGVSEEEIREAERKLGVVFSKDYREYVSNFGVVSAGGHEFTGICSAVRLNVVDVTLDERRVTSGVCHAWYVIEQANIDGIVIWQSEDGKIYQTMPNTEPMKISNSLLEYIEEFLS